MRRPQRIEPGPGQESVWDYPRPPALVSTAALVEVRAGGVQVAVTSGAYRVLETSHPPTYYLPPGDVVPGVLVPAPGTSICEWKGRAAFWDVVVGDEAVRGAAWSYPDPAPRYREIAGFVSFYPSLLECFVDGERVAPQAGGFYGGWITADVVGPFKGEEGTQWW